MVRVPGRANPAAASCAAILSRAAASGSVTCLPYGGEQTLVSLDPDHHLTGAPAHARRPALGKEAVAQSQTRRNGGRGEVGSLANGAVSSIASPVPGDAGDRLPVECIATSRAQGSLSRLLSAASLARRRKNVIGRLVLVLSALEPFLDDARVLRVGDLDLAADLGVHRHLPQPRPVRLGEGPVVLVRAAHPAHRRAGISNRPRRLDARA